MKKRKNKKRDNEIFESIRKKTPPPSKRFKSDKEVIERKKKYKENIIKELE